MKLGDRGCSQDEDRDRLCDCRFAIVGEEAWELGATEGSIGVEIGGKLSIFGLGGSCCCLRTGGGEGIGDDCEGEEGDIVFLRKTEGSR